MLYEVITVFRMIFLEFLFYPGRKPVLQLRQQCCRISISDSFNVISIVGFIHYYNQLDDLFEIRLQKQINKINEKIVGGFVIV